MFRQINKNVYVFYEILQWLEEHERSKMGLLSKKFYEKIVPQSMEKSSKISTMGMIRH